MLFFINLRYIISMSNSFTEQYHKILCPVQPEFLDKYLSIPILTRLKGVGLLCGTDWTPFFSNNFYYSRFDHSKGVALLIWNFTHDKAQTIAGLLHDVSTPAFSHVADFRKGDALTQTATEEDNSSMLASSPELLECLKLDGLTLDQVDNYHKYPVADNEVPQLSADRLEYMFPSGAALAGNWSLKESFTLEEIEIMYNDLVLCKNENGIVELGFKTKSIAEKYVKRVTDIAFFLQQCEDKMALQFPAEVLNMAVKLNVLKEADFFDLSESEIISKLDKLASQYSQVDSKAAFEASYSLEKLAVFIRTYRGFKSITRSEVPLDDYFCINLKVKKRYINPLVSDGTVEGNLYKAKRITEISAETDSLIKKFLSYEDLPFSCVKFL